MNSFFNSIVNRVRSFKKEVYTFRNWIKILYSESWQYIVTGQASPEYKKDNY